jgi:hypothetical protein
MRPLVTLRAGSTDYTTRRGGSGVCGVGDGGGTAVACNSKNTKLPELRFRAVGGDDVREPLFERLLAR